MVHLLRKNRKSSLELKTVRFSPLLLAISTFDKSKNSIKQLIRNFGSAGGGLFSRDIELGLLQAASSDGNVYFRLKEALANSINQLILGQTASSSDSSGLSGGDAQSKVRQDILDADCRRISRTINAQLIIPWTKYNYGDTLNAPKFTLDCSVAEDKLALAQTLGALATAGFEADENEMSERFGFKLKRKEVESMPFGEMRSIDSLDKSDSGDESDIVKSQSQETLNLKQKYDAMGVAIRAGLLTATPEIEAQTRNELGLPTMTVEVQKSWEATGGIRQPITLKTAESAAVNEALDVDNKSTNPTALSDTAEKTRQTLVDALEEWLTPLANDLESLSNLSDDALDKKLKSGDLSTFGNSEKLENLMAEDMKKSWK